ncbi:MAG TPA: tetratricopeptide repeat protein [Thermoplasmata archaeon]|nr:tetratricopeptide repeat protein [Thermoplasmata archaeon]
MPTRAPPDDGPPPPPAPTGAAAVRRAHELFKQGQTREALALLRPLLQRKEVDADAAALAAACLGSEGKYEEAGRVDRLLCDAQPRNPQGWNSLGFDLLNAGDLAGALDAYARAIDLEPTRASAHYNVARICARMGERSKAIEHFVRAVELQPDFIERLDEDPDLRPLKDSPDLLARLPGQPNPEDPYASWYATES